jgi:hypothetical protein
VPIALGWLWRHESGTYVKFTCRNAQSLSRKVLFSSSTASSMSSSMMLIQTFEVGGASLQGYQNGTSESSSRSGSGRSRPSSLIPNIIADLTVVPSTMCRMQPSASRMIWMT